MTATHVDPVTGMPFVFVEGGRFDMGDLFGDGFPDELPVVPTKVGDFWIGRYPVTQGQWRKVMDYNPSMFKKGDDYPLEMVSWDQAQDFIAKLNELTEGGYRLPREAEWEFAARDRGQKRKWAGTSDIEELVDFAWYDANSTFRTHPVGLKKPNALGLCDMSGGAHEWTHELYFTDAHAALASGAKIPETGGSHRSFRGGSWKRHAEGLRCSRRMGGLPDQGFGTYGLRLAKDA